MNTITNLKSVGEIVAFLPRAADIFKEYQIDFCCGGDKSLKEASLAAGADEAAVLEKLNLAIKESQKVLRENKKFTEMDNNELIDHIIRTHHVYMRKVLPLLGELTEKILVVHGPTHNELFEIHSLFNTLRTEIQQHLIKEEEILFPWIKNSESSISDAEREKVVKTAKETEDEHLKAGDILKRLRKITDNYAIPDDVCQTYEYTYNKLQELESDLFNHIHLENNILFKRM